jgi:hypothetical protein
MFCHNKKLREREKRTKKQKNRNFKQKMRNNNVHESNKVVYRGVSLDFTIANKHRNANNKHT